MQFIILVAFTLLIAPKSFALTSFERLEVGYYEPDQYVGLKFCRHKVSRMTLSTRTDFSNSPNCRDAYFYCYEQPDLCFDAGSRFSARVLTPTSYEVEHRQSGNKVVYNKVEGKSRWVSAKIECDNGLSGEFSRGNQAHARGMFHFSKFTPAEVYASVYIDEDGDRSGAFHADIGANPNNLGDTHNSGVVFSDHGYTGNAHTIWVGDDGRKNLELIIKTSTFTGVRYPKCQITLQR